MITVGADWFTEDVREESRLRIDEYWRRFFGVDDFGHGHGVLVVHGSALVGYPGVFVVLRKGQVIVSVPEALADTAGAWPLTEETVADASWWHDRLPGWVVLGPSVHSFLDRTDVEPDATRSRPASVAEVHRTLRTRVTDDEWAESGFDGNLEKVWVLHGDAGGDVVAAANLSLFDGSPADVGVLVARDARGRGHAAQVAATATFDAVQGHGIARWRSLRSNDASRRTAFRLGFQDDCVQLAIRPRVASTG